MMKPQKGKIPLVIDQPSLLLHFHMHESAYLIEGVDWHLVFVGSTADQTDHVIRGKNMRTAQTEYTAPVFGYGNTVDGDVRMLMIGPIIPDNALYGVMNREGNVFVFTGA